MTLNPFFLSECWASSWLETLGDGATAHRLKLAGDASVALAARRREGFRVIRPAGGDVADYEELPIDGVAGGGALAAVDAVMRDARSDVLMLAHVPDRSRTLEWARSAPSERVAIYPRGSSWVTELAGDWETQQQRLRQKLVNDTRRCERRLGEQLGSPAVERVNDAGAILETVDFIARTHRARHNALGRFSIFERPEVHAFYRQLAQRCRDDERLHVTRLRAGGRTVAAHLGFAAPDRFLYYLPTFDQEYSRYSPGRVLAFALMRESIEAGRRWFDLGIGDEPYKHEFAPDEVAQWTVLVTAPTARGRLAKRWFTRVRPWVGRRLERLAPLLYRAGIVRDMS